jgi:hypothetical protein
VLDFGDYFGLEGNYDDNGEYVRGYICHPEEEALHVVQKHFKTSIEALEI